MEHLKSAIARISLTSLSILFTTWSFSQGFPDWKSTSQRSEIAPLFSVDQKNKFNGQPTLVIEGGNKAHADGHWFKTVPVKAGKYFEFLSKFKFQNVDEPHRSILSRVIWLDEKDGQLGFSEYPLTLPEPDKDGWFQFHEIYQAPDGAVSARLELHYRWDADGSVRFTVVSFLETAPPKPRMVKVATIHHRPRNTKSPSENIDQFASLIAQAGAQRADIVCLPEAFTIAGNGLNYVSGAEAVPGETTRRLGAIAVKNNLYIVAGILEREGEVVYNTAVLIGRDGKLAGKYRKVSLPREEIDGGITPGNSFPVFDTDFGKVGMMICWDVTFPEAARTLTQNGAEIIFMPIAGGHLKLAMARALENQVYLVSSTYDMISAVFDLEGNVLKEATTEAPVAVTEIDLNQRKMWPWIGDLKNRISREMPSNKSTETIYNH